MREIGVFQSSTSKKRYWIIIGALAVAALLFTAGLLAYGNPMEFGSTGYWLIAQRRMNAVIAMAIVAVCQATATVAFQTVTNNRILTPSIMGFESLYVAIHTSTVYFLGAAGLINAHTLQMFVIQLVLMIGLSLVLYTWLLAGKNPDMLSLIHI